MRAALFSLLILISLGSAFAQLKDEKSKPLPNSFQKDTTKVEALLKISRFNTNNKPNQAVREAEEALLESKRIKSSVYEMRSLNSLGFALFVTGNYPRALKISLQGQQLAKKLDNEFGLITSFSNIGNIYRRQGNYEGAIAYLLKAKKHAEQRKAVTHAIVSTLGICYLENGQINLAMKYLQDSFTEQIQTKFDGISLTYNRLGDLQKKLNNNPLALAYYRQGVAAAAQHQQYRWLCFNYLSLASLYFNQKRIDSSIYYAQKAISVGNHRFLDQTQQSSIILSNSYGQLNKSDSCLKYLRLAIAIKDTIQNNKEEAEIENLLFEDRLQKIEAAEAKAKLAEERAHNLQYSAIAITLILFMITFLLVSHSRLANSNMIRFLGILSLLIVFEFVNLLLHPYLGALVHHSPIWMLVIMVFIASLLIPLHHKLEHWIVEKLIQRNAKIRLASVKKQ